MFFHQHIRFSKMPKEQNRFIIANLQTVTNLWCRWNKPSSFRAQCWHQEKLNAVQLCSSLKRYVISIRITLAHLFQVNAAVTLDEILKGGVVSRNWIWTQEWHNIRSHFIRQNNKSNCWQLVAYGFKLTATVASRIEANRKLVRKRMYILPVLKPHNYEMPFSADH